ncbi:glycosyltransferase family 39 protein [Flavobacteriaceae bacterium]|nr:glycosyltransferase family 39 protein [Flavobacteriaceae bacterium]
MRKVFWFIVSVITLLVLTYNFRLGVEAFQDTHGYFGGDSGDYILVGASLAKTGKYGHLKSTPKEIIADLNSGDFLKKEYEFGNYSTWRPPIWPSFLAIFFKLFPNALLLAHLVKFLLIIGGAYLFYRTLISLRFSKSVSIIFAVFYLIHPTLQLYSRTFLSESFTYLIMTILLYFAVRTWQDSNKINVFMTGLTGGLLVLTHPYYLALPFVLVGLIFLIQRSKVINYFIAFPVLMFVIGFWVVRNHVIYPDYSFFITSSTGAVMAKGWNAKVPELHNNVNGDLADEGLVLKPDDQMAGLNEVERSELYQKRTKEFVKENSRMIVPILIKKLKSAFNPIREISKPGFLQNLNELHRILILLIFFYVLFRWKLDLFGIIALTIILSTIFITGLTYSGIRFRSGQVPLEILLIALALKDLGVLNYIRTLKSSLACSFRKKMSPQK